MSLSNLMEEETIGSFIVRNMLSSGEEDIRKICSPLFNSASSNWNIFPCANEIFLTRAKILLSKISFEEISKKHTLIPLLKLTSSHNLEDTFKRYLMTYMGKERVKQFRTNVVSIGENLTSEIKYCTSCFEEQIQNYGFSWFKREWQISGMSHCLRHNRKLINPLCNICANNSAPLRQIESAFNQKCCYCSAGQPHSKYEVVNNPIANWSLELLNSNFPAFSNDLIRFLVRYSYIQLGGDTSADKFNMAEFFAILFSPNHHERLPVLNSIGRTYTSPRDYKHMMVGLLSKPMENYVHTYAPLICLIHPLTLVFPNFDDFKYFLEDVSYEREGDVKPIKILDLKFGLDNNYLNWSNNQ